MAVQFGFIFQRGVLGRRSFFEPCAAHGIAAAVVRVHLQPAGLKMRGVDTLKTMKTDDRGPAPSELERLQLALAAAKRNVNEAKLRLLVAQARARLQTGMSRARERLTTKTR